MENFDLEMKMISLFSGLGGFEKAMKNIGMKVDLRNFCEIDKYATESFLGIHKEDPEKNWGDVANVRLEEVEKDVDMITYSFPCQDISVAGEQKGIKKGTRSGMLFEAEKIIAHSKPKYAIAENVKNLVGARHMDDFYALLGRLEEYGYNNYWAILNAEDFGLPQTRERVFIVSIRKDIDDGKFSMPEGWNLTKTIEDILEEGVDSFFAEDSNEYNNYDKEKVDKSEIKTSPIQVGNSRQFGNAVRNNGIAYTLRAANPNGILTEDYKIRKYTPLEAFRLMGYDDEDYWNARRRLEEVFYNGRDRSSSQMYKQAGNSVVVPVVEEIMKEIGRMENRRRETNSFM